MKKIIIVSLIGTKPVGGVERVVNNLKEILSDTDSVKIIQSHINLWKFQIIFYPLWFSFKLLFARKKIVISNSWQAFLYPSDFSIHHGTTAGYINNFPESKSLGACYISWMEKVSARRAKRVIAVSENCRKELVNLYKISPDKIFVLNNFVDEEHFHPLVFENKNEKSSLTLLFSGSAGKRKGVEHLLNLAAYIEGKKNVFLKIASPSDTNAGLFSNFSHNTTFLSGLRFDQMNDFYNSGDVLFFPTKYEGFSMATLEALCSGIPILGSNYAVPVELQKYDFAKRIEDFSPEKVIEEALKLKKKYSSCRYEIHDIVKKEFGKEQYVRKLYGLIGETEK